MQRVEGDSRGGAPAVVAAVSQPSNRPAQLIITSGKVIARHPLLGERVFLRSPEAPARVVRAPSGAATRARGDQPAAGTRRPGPRRGQR